MREKVDVRIIAATNRICPVSSKAVCFGRLYYRINVVTIKSRLCGPGWRHSSLLVRHFAEKFASELGKTVPRFSEKAMEAMQKLRLAGQCTRTGERDPANRRHER